MKRRYFALQLLCAFFAVTLAVGNVAAGEPLKRKTPKMEVVFVLDTTGSMSGLIQGAKEKIWSIAGSMTQTQPTPSIKFGLVAYRDRGDEYVTARTDLTGDLDQIYATLMDFNAAGGGDSPESVNQALHEAIAKMSWSRDPDSYRAVFLVGDAPPHMDYQDDIKYHKTGRIAAQNGIVLNTIQCGNLRGTEPVWREIASLTNGSFFKVTQEGSALIASSPFDAKIAKLATELDKTKIFYGSSSEQKMAGKRKHNADAISSRASVSAKARRAEFNVSEAGAENFFGSKELVRDVETGKAKLASINKDQLPANMKKMSAKERKKYIGKLSAKRSKLKAQIQELTAKRQAHLKKQLESRKSEVKSSLSQKVYDSVRRQAAEKNINFESEEALH